MFKKRSIALFIANIFTLLYLWQVLVVVQGVSALDFTGTVASISANAPEILASIAAADPMLGTLTLVFLGVALVIGVVSFWIRNHWGALIAALAFLGAVITFSNMVNLVYTMAFIGLIILGLLFSFYGFVQQFFIAHPRKEKKQ